MSKVKPHFLFIVVLTAFLSIYSSAKAKTVYAIPNHSVGTVKAYDIQSGYQDGQIDYRATYDLQLNRPTDVTIDVESDMLFVTFEFEKRIELIDARTFLSEGFAIADEASDLAGIVFSYIDPNTTHVFTVDRGEEKLYAYEWDASDKTLTPIIPDANDLDNPNYGNDDPYFLLEPGDPNVNPNSSIYACILTLKTNGFMQAVIQGMVI